MTKKVKKSYFKLLPAWLKTGIIFVIIDFLIIITMFLLINLTGNISFVLLGFTQLIGFVVWFFLEPLNTSNSWIPTIFSLIIGLLCWFLMGVLYSIIMQKIKSKKSKQ